VRRGVAESAGMAGGARAGQRAAIESPLWAQVAAAYDSGRQATAAVEAYFYANDSLPATLAAAGASAQPADSKSVELIQFSPESAVIKVMTRITSVHGQGVLVFTPPLDGDKRIVWRCAAQDLGAQVLPANCR
jgi:hypothetical protein